MATPDKTLARIVLEAGGTDAYRARRESRRAAVRRSLMAVAFVLTFSIGVLAGSWNAAELLAEVEHLRAEVVTVNAGACSLAALQE